MSEIKNPSVIDASEVSDEEFSSLVDSSIKPFDDGDLVTGKVVKIDQDEVLLDIGFKSEGVIPARELSIRKDVVPADLVKDGEEIEVLVLQKEDKDGRLLLSKRRAEYERGWISVEEKFKAGQNVEGEVIEVVKGGLILDIGLRGFLPASLVDLRRVKDLDMYLGQTIEARVIEMDRNRNNVVLSRRVVLEEGRKQERAEVLQKLAEGMRLKGTVSSIVDFGAFVDLGGIDGLVHISELSWNHVNHPSECVKVGQDVEVMVLDVDMQRERISLGLKQTSEDPWRTLVKNYPVGSIIEGNVTKLVPFGCFVELGDGIEGLVHISEMANVHVDIPSQVCTVGDKVQVKVMDVDLERRRISLSMKAAAETLGVDIDVAVIDNGSPKDDKKKAGKSKKAGKGADKAAKDAKDGAGKGDAADKGTSEDKGEADKAADADKSADEVVSDKDGEHLAKEADSKEAASDKGDEHPAVDEAKEADDKAAADKSADKAAEAEEAKPAEAEDKAEEAKPADEAEAKPADEKPAETEEKPADAAVAEADANADAKDAGDDKPAEEAAAEPKED